MSKYQCPESCNKCGRYSNELLGIHPLHPYSSGEVKTKCKDCGFEDYWAHGYFESGSCMESKAKTYSFGEGK